MKKFVFLSVITCLVIGTVFAQNQGREKRNPPEQITVEGTLQLQDGTIAVKSGETVYYVPMLHRYAGFVEGIKEGNRVSIEGYALKNHLRPTKLTISGKSYDFPVKNVGQKTGSGQRNGARPQLRHGHNNRFAQRHMGPQSRYYMGHGRGSARGHGFDRGRGAGQNKR
ncbi:MAG: hypothetical protein FWG07_01630 [Treponema sp.]|nr:hypothetical protein [Treponema sp.]